MDKYSDKYFSQIFIGSLVSKTHPAMPNLYNPNPGQDLAGKIQYILHDDAERYTKYDRLLDLGFNCEQVMDCCEVLPFEPVSHALLVGHPVTGKDPLCMDSNSLGFRLLRNLNENYFFKFEEISDIKMVDYRRLSFRINATGKVETLEFPNSAHMFSFIRDLIRDPANEYRIIKNDIFVIRGGGDVDGPRRRVRHNAGN